MTTQFRLQHADAPPPEWAAFARSHGAFYHEAAWGALLARVFAFPVTYASAWGDNGLVAILPFAETRSPLGRRRLVSLPFSYAAGPVGDPDACCALAEGAREWAQARGIRTVELKRLERDGEPAAGFQRSLGYATYPIDLTGGEAAVWGRLHADSTRRGIRRAERDGVKVEQGCSPADWDTFAGLQEVVSHGHGVPAPPRAFFAEGCRALQAAGLADLLVARREGVVLGGVVLWKGARAWIHAFGATRPDAAQYRPTHLLLWTAIRQAIAAGAGFDLGRASGTQVGLVQFKQRWGGVATALAYDYWPGTAGVHTMPRDRGVLHVAGRIWTHLPASVARFGSRLYRYLG